jgi:hypothetical protein
VSLIGCGRSGIPSSIQPDEYVVYHALLLRYAASNPQHRESQFVQRTVFQPSEFNNEIRERSDEENYGYLERCMSKNAVTAFRKLGIHPQYPLDDTTLKGWRNLSDGTTLPYLSDSSRPAKYTSVHFSRVFFEPGNREAYVYERVSWYDQGYGGSGVFLRAVRADDGTWTFLRTNCRDMS